MGLLFIYGEVYPAIKSKALIQTCWRLLSKHAEGSYPNMLKALIQTCWRLLSKHAEGSS